MLFDLCVVGAGMMGSAAARHASANPGLKICLLGPEEPKKEIWEEREIFGSHYDEGRLTRILDDDLACQVLCQHSIDRYRELERLSSVPFYNPIGFLYIAKEHSSHIEKIKQAALYGRIRFLDLSYSSLLSQRYPYMKLKPDEKAFLHEEGSGHISPRNMVLAQKKVASDQGCVLISDVVTEVKPLTRNEMQTYHEVHTMTGKVVKAKRILICTGAFTNFKKLIPDVGGAVPDITVDQETVALLKISEKEAFRLQSMPTAIYHPSADISDDVIGAYILPPIKYPDGHWYLKIGHINETGKTLSTLKDVKNWYLSPGDPNVIRSHSELLCDMLPGLEIIEIKSATCVSCRSPTGLPYIDRVTPTISIAAVGNGKGAKFSDEVGRIAAELSISGKWDSELPQSLFNVVWKMQPSRL